MATLGRQKNRDWADGAPISWDYANLAILQDIRDELQRLNGLLHCYSVVNGFRALSRIAKQSEAVFKRRVDAAVRKRVARRKP